jgi:DNA-binding CsgD family transcriptional regulator
LTEGFAMTGRAVASDSQVRIRAPRFVGRDREMAALDRALTAAPAVILVEGEAGIGKSRLITEYLAAGAGERMRVLRAACLPFRRPHTLGPLVDAIRDLTEGVAGLRLSPLAGALRPLFPEWAGELPAAPEPAEDATAARHRLFRALAELTERLRVTLVIVEDVHWADEATLEFLLFLTSRRQRAASLLLTRRPEDTSAGSLLPLLSSRPERITLGPLGIGGTVELIASMLDDAVLSEEFAGFVHRATEGVPLAVEELVRLMGDRADLIRSDGEWLRTELDEIEVPPTIRDAVMERVRRLGDPAKSVLRAAAVLAEPTAADTLAAVTELAPEPARAGVTEALASGVLAEDRSGRLEYRHTLACRAVLDATAVSERGALHLRAATVLEAAGAAEPATLARHFREAGEAGAWAVHAERAADAALASGDESSATRLLHELISGAGLDAATLVRVMRKLTFGCLRSGTDFDPLLRALRAVLRQDLAAPVRGEVRYELGRVLLSMDQFGAALAELERAIPDLERCAPVRAAEAMAAEALAVFRMPHGEGPPPATHYERLRRLEAASAGLAPLDRLRITGVRATVLLAMGQAEGWAVAATIPEEGGTAAELAAIAVAQLNLAEFAMRWGRYAEARQRLRLGTALAERRRYRRFLDFARVTGGRLDYFTGNWAGLRRRVAALSQVAGLPPVDRMEVLLLTGLLKAAHGGAEQAEADLRQVMAEATRAGAPEYAAEAAARLGRLFLAARRVQDALAVTEQAMRHVAGRENWTWAVDLVQVRVEALAAAGLAAEAGECAQLFARWTRGCAAPAADAAVASCQAINAGASGEPAAAAAAFSRAAALWQALPRPYEALLARERQAEHLIGAGRPDDGIKLLREVLDGLHELGAGDDERRVTGALRRRGVAARRPGAGRPSYGARLSPRERDVARLVAEGLTNAEIAGRLFLSPSTVAQHVNSARRKVNAASRTALAVHVAEGGLD